MAPPVGRAPTSRARPISVRFPPDSLSLAGLSTGRSSNHSVQSYHSLAWVRSLLLNSRAQLRSRKVLKHCVDGVEEYTNSGVGCPILLDSSSWGIVDAQAQRAAAKAGWVRALGVGFRASACRTIDVPCAERRVDVPLRKLGCFSQFILAVSWRYCLSRV